MDDRTTYGVRAGAGGGMLALGRVYEADRQKDRFRAGIHAAESALWLRALGDVFRALDPDGSVSGPRSVTPPGIVEVSDGRPSYRHGQVVKGLRIVGNKGIHEMIFPTAAAPSFDFLRTQTISSGYSYSWAPLSAWEHSVDPGRPISADGRQAYLEALAGRPVVATLRIALGVYRERAALHGVDTGGLFDALGRSSFAAPHF